MLFALLVVVGIFFPRTMYPRRSLPLPCFLGSLEVLRRALGVLLFTAAAVVTLVWNR